MQSGLVMMIMS